MNKTDKLFSHAENLQIRMNVLYKESDYTFTDLVHTVEIETTVFKWQTLASIGKYCSENNLMYYMKADKSKCILTIIIKNI